MSNEERVKRLDCIIAQLDEFAGCFELLASWTLPTGGTFNYFSGRGNWYARQGMAREFLERDSAETLGNVIKDDSEESSG